MVISVATPSGLEGVTKREIYNLIGENASAINGRLRYNGDIEKVALFNLHLRTASRVFIEVGSFKASTFDELFDGTCNLDFENYIDKFGKIEVYGTSIESKLASISASASIIKKAICKRLIEKYKCNLNETGERYKIEFVIRHDYVIISLDTSGDGLHKRGYRKHLIGDAPLKENVAASLIYLSVWNLKRPFIDLFCGSGTLPIEAGLIAKNIAPGLNRDFDFLHYKKFDLTFYDSMLNEAKSKIISDCDCKIFGFDIDENQIKLARSHAVSAGVDDVIHFQRQDMRDFSSKQRYGVIITNPPYGERLLTRNQIVNLYKAYGNVCKKLNDWSIYTLTSVSDFTHLFGKKEDKKRKIYNGKLECYFYTFLGAPPPKNTDK